METAPSFSLKVLLIGKVKTFNSLKDENRAAKRKKPGNEMKYELNILQNHKREKNSDHLTYLLLKH